MTYPTEIPMTDKGWRQITLSAKSINGANARTSPLTNTVISNLAGLILHSSYTETRGLVNEAYTYNDGARDWLLISITDVLNPLSNYPHLWVAKDVINYELGEFVNLDIGEILFYDLSLPGQPTIRIPANQKDLLVELLHSIASYLNSLEGIK